MTAGERIAKFVGREVRAVLPGPQPYGIRGILIACNDRRCCIRGHNGNDFVVPFDEVRVIEIYPELKSGPTQEQNLPRVVDG